MAAATLDDNVVNVDQAGRIIAQPHLPGCFADGATADEEQGRASQVAALEVKDVAAAGAAIRAIDSKPTALFRHEVAKVDNGRHDAEADGITVGFSVESGVKGSCVNLKGAIVAIKIEKGNSRLGKQSSGG
jgi:hypothetical protein